MVPLLFGHCLQVNIELKRTAFFVDEIAGFAEIIVSIVDQISGDRVRYTLCIDVAALLTADLVLDVRTATFGDASDGMASPHAARSSRPSIRRRASRVYEARH